MFRKLKEAFLGVWSDDRDPNAPLRLERAAMNRSVADLVEQALVSGAYQGPCNGENSYMCLVLNHCMTEKGDVNRVAAERIMFRIYPHATLRSYLVSKGELEHDAGKFETRIFCSNWFWSFIRDQRGHAERLENQQSLSSLAR